METEETVTYCPNAGYLKSYVTAALKALVGLDLSQASYVLDQVQKAVWRASEGPGHPLNTTAYHSVPSPRVILGEPIE